MRSTSYFARCLYWVFVSLVLLGAELAIAANWQLAVTGDLWNERSLDIESIRRESSNSPNITYQIRYEFGGKYPSKQRTVVSNCQSRERLEIIDQNDNAYRELKSVYPGTAQDVELNFACRYFGQQAGVGSAVPPPLDRGPQAPPSPKKTPPLKDKAASSTGSGFVVAPNLIITNNHVVEGCTVLRVRRGAFESPVKLKGATEKSDLALLIAPSGFSTPVPIRSSAALGEDVMVAGHPLSGLLGTDLIVTSGQVNALAGLLNDPTLLQISAPVQPGNSGGPIIDRSGDVVGVVVSKLNVEKMAKITGDVSQNINFAIKPEVLRMFLDANQVPYSTSRQGKRLENSELAQRARAFTVQVICE